VVQEQEDRRDPAASKGNPRTYTKEKPYKLLSGRICLKLYRKSTLKPMKI
jgi:hypothetical protein